MKNQDYELHKFLSKHGAVRKFKANVERAGGWTYLEELQKGEGDPNVIAGAFIWSDAPEGGDYWMKLNHKYSNSFD